VIKSYQDNIPLLEAARAALPSLPVAGLAVKRPLSVRLERQFGNGGAALGAGPVTFIHLPLAGKILIVHSFLFTKIFNR
jgi:hypothetical protein